MPLGLKNSARTERIARAAGQLFARQGYHGTSTREIARLSGVSENTLFRHFDNKEDLFWSTLCFHSSGLKLRQDLVDGLMRCDPPEIVLPKILELLTDTASFNPELLRMIAVAFLELHWRADIFGNEYLAPVLSQLSRYLDANIKEGKLRGLDPTILTAALMMTTIMHPGISRLIGGNGPSFRNSPEAGRAYARFWLDLLSPGLSSYPIPSTEMAAEHLG